MKYKLMKVFKIGDMPPEIQIAFDKYAEDECGNFIRIWGHDECKPKEEYKGGKILHESDGYILEEGDNPLEDWLVSNGAKLFETVIVET